MNPYDLIRIARHLATGGVGGNRGRPRQADLRRAVSTAYYALFHALSRCCADTLAGGTPAHRRQRGWQLVYRSLEHGPARNRLSNPAEMQTFPPEIRNFGLLFVEMQRQRHRADYDPTEAFAREHVLQFIAQTEQAVVGLEQCASADCRSFALYTLFRPR